MAHTRVIVEAWRREYNEELTKKSWVNCPLLLMPKG
jgi:hypothetical protein